MKNILALAALLAVAVAATANAASISVVKTAPSAYSLYLLAGAGEVFDSVGVKMVPVGAATFTLQNSGLASGAPRPAGQAFSYRNRILDLDPADPDNSGGLGWGIVGAISNTTELSFGGGPSNAKITTPGAPGLFLANVNMPSGSGIATVNLVNNGVDLAPIAPLTFGIPEPASCLMAGLSMLGLVAARRRLV